MAATHTFTERPSMLPFYGKALFQSRPGLRAGQTLPALSAAWPDARIALDGVRGYRDATGTPDDGHLPLLYPHILASGLHLAMLTDKAFPLSLLGAVHLRNHVLQHAPIPQDAVLSLSTRIGGQRVVKAGLEFDMTTEVLRDGVRVWESISTNLVRGKKFGEPGEPPAIAHLPELDGVNQESSWRVPPYMGRRYAKITGDFNPIHIANVTAKLFGFPRAIIHGMWSAARALGQLPALPGDGPLRFDVAFKGPIFVGAQSTMKAHCDGSAQRFDCYCAGNDRPCISGLVRREASGATLIGEAAACCAPGCCGA
jgi:acyl dehydratase